ncbi:hypothetical protein [Flavobacterium sp.]|uniref:hypothetical protein n=1 Tax=Flavobacterium sp. TaxID=239 RepID=UPI002B4B5604|nr:hypothetical protein [Flavobacterium sp.]HLF52292.1 hypothetical protein [Flavobacterium sp.]
MSTLKKSKKEAYKKILKKEFGNLSDEKLEELIEYLFELALWEVKVLNKGML